MPELANIESSAEIDPDSFAASSVPERFDGTPGGDAAADQAAADAKAASDKAAADQTAKAEADKATAEAADKAAKEKIEADKAKAELENPNLAAVKQPEPEDDKKPAGMTDKAWVSWKAKNAEVKTAKQEAAAERTRSAELQAKLDASIKLSTEHEALKKELEATKQKLTDYEGEVYVSRIESHPEFKANIKGPMDAITSSVSAIATRYEIAPDVLLKAIQEPDEAKRTDLLEEAITEFKRVDQITVAQAADRFQSLRAKADDMRKDAGKKLEEMTAADKEANEKMNAQTAKDYQSAVESEWDTAQQLYPYIRKVDGADKWNTHLDGHKRDAAAVDVSNLPVERVAKAEIALRILPEVAKAAKHFQTKNAELQTKLDASEKKLKEYLASAPGAGAGAAAREATSSEGGDGDESFTGAAMGATR